MMEIWLLKLCIGVSWAGCGSWQTFEYPSEDSCYRALAAIRTEVPIADGTDKRRSSVALCYPKTKPSTGDK